MLFCLGYHALCDSNKQQFYSAEIKDTNRPHLYLAEINCSSLLLHLVFHFDIARIKSAWA